VAPSSLALPFLFVIRQIDAVWSCALLLALHHVNPEFSSPIKVSLPKSVTKASSRHRWFSLWESGISGARRLSPGSTFARPCKRGSVSIYKGPSSGFHFLSSLLPFLFDLNWQVAFGVPSGASLWNSHYLDIVSSYVVYILTSCLFDQIMNPNVQFTIFHSCRIDSVSSRMPAACWCSHLSFFFNFCLTWIALQQSTTDHCHDILWHTHHWPTSVSCIWFRLKFNSCSLSVQVSSPLMCSTVLDLQDW